MSDFRLKAFYSVARNLSFTKASQEPVCEPAGSDQACTGAGEPLRSTSVRPEGEFHFAHGGRKVADGALRTDFDDYRKPGVRHAPVEQ